MSDSVRPHRQQPTRLPCPWDSPGKNTGVGCHFLLQCMKLKSESEIAQSCPTHRDPMDCSLPGSSIHGIFQARVPEWGATAFSITRLAYLISPKPVALFLFSGVVCVGEGTAAAATAKSLQSCLTLCDRMDCRLPGSSIHGIFQARVLEWGAIAFSRIIC